MCNFPCNFFTSHQICNRDRYTKTHEGLGDKRKEIIGKCQDIQKKMQDLQAAEKKVSNNMSFPLEIINDLLCYQG